MPRPFDAVSLDIGGVLLVPDHGVLAYVLARRGIDFDQARFGPAHYHAMHEVDTTGARPEEFDDYLGRFLHEVGVPAERRAEAHEALEMVFETPIWCQPVPGSRQAAVALAAAGVALGVTSNSDGTIEDLLRRHEICQVGDGPGFPVACITDSGVLGTAKPDPKMFEATVAALGLPPGRVLHVGDSVRFDVEGASAAGLQVAHFDPFGLCRRDDHPHARSLADLLARAGGG
jgi:putative hydrolase of the HAD superfamily